MDAEAEARAREIVDVSKLYDTIGPEWCAEVEGRIAAALRAAEERIQDETDQKHATWIERVLAQAKRDAQERQIATQAWENAETELREVRAQHAEVEREVGNLAAETGFDLDGALRTKAFGETPVTALVHYLLAAEQIALGDKRYEEARAEAAEQRLAAVMSVLDRMERAAEHSDATAASREFIAFLVAAVRAACTAPPPERKDAP